jgi:hypothetical protein
MADEQPHARTATSMCVAMVEHERSFCETSLRQGHRVPPARWIMKRTSLRRRHLGPAAKAAGPSF